LPDSRNSASTNCGSDGAATLVSSFSRSTSARNRPGKTQPTRYPCDKILEKDEQSSTRPLRSKDFAVKGRGPSKARSPHRSSSITATFRRLVKSTKSRLNFSGKTKPSGLWQFVIVIHALILC